MDSILLLAGSGATSAEESDARTIVSYELLVSAFGTKFKSASSTPGITAEMAHVTSKLQFPRSGDLVLIRPRILGYLQSHVALRRELNSVFSALFMPGHGASISIQDIGHYLSRSGADVCFAELEEQAAERFDLKSSWMHRYFTPNFTSGRDQSYRYQNWGQPVSAIIGSIPSVE